MRWYMRRWMATISGCFKTALDCISGSEVKMMRASKGNRVFVTVAIFILVTIVIYMSRRIESMKVKMPQREPARTDFPLPTTEVKTNRTKTRLNVILLTHFSSGSTVMGNMFNLHPNVFYIYEPLNSLRREIDTNEWRVLPKTTNDAYRNGFSTLLRDLFTCGFQEKRTLKLVFPELTRSFNEWYNPSMPLTSESLRKACNARKITVTKIMQTRLRISELERVCHSGAGMFNCLIVHLVRDPRAVLSSLIPRRFFMEGPAATLLSQKPMSPQGITLLKENAQKLCSLVLENLDHVNTQWSNWFKRRYILVRYEDAINDLSKAASDMYKFVGLPMADIITKWIKGAPPAGHDKSRDFGMVVSNNDAATIDKWRFREKTWLVSLFEEACRPLMEKMGYILVNGSEYLQHNNSKPLRTVNIPFLRSLRGQEA